MEGVQRRAPPAARHARFDRIERLFEVVDQAGREIVGFEAAGPERIVLHARGALGARGRRAAMRPAGDAIASIQRCAQRMHAEGPVEIVGEIVLARPHQLDGFAGEFGDQDGFGDEVVLEAATEAATRARQADLDLVARPGRSAG